MIRIGLVGIGFMGMIHYLAARKLKGARVTAICSRDARKLAGDWRGIRGNFGPLGEKMDLGGIKRYARLNDLLADPDIALVDVCNPTHLHAETALAAHRALEDAVRETEDLRILGAAFAAAGRTEEARRTLSEVIERATEHGRPLLVAVAQRDLSQVLGSVGDVAAARELRRAARTTFERLGAKAELAKLEGVRQAAAS